MNKKTPYVFLIIFLTIFAIISCTETEQSKKDQEKIKKALAQVLEKLQLEGEDLDNIEVVVVDEEDQEYSLSDSDDELEDSFEDQSSLLGEEQEFFMQESINAQTDTIIPPQTEEIEEIEEEEEIPKPGDDLVEAAIKYFYGDEDYDLDTTKSISLLENAADMGNDEAMQLLGNLYLFGDVVEIDYKKAFNFFNESAQLGNPDAQFKLGFMYSTGKGVEINTPLSLLYYTFASQGENFEAQIALGYKKFYGHNVGKLCTQAVEKYEIVASETVLDIDDHFMTLSPNFPRLSDNQNELSKDEAEEEVIQYYQFSADQNGDAQAQVTIGSLYLQGGYGLEQNYENAFRYFQQAAFQGDALGMSNLGYMYLKGFGVSQNNITGLKYINDAVKLGHPHAQTQLGLRYLNQGIGAAKNNEVQAIKYFNMAAEKGYFEAQLQLGNLYYFGGITIKQDFTKALQYYSLAAHQGHAKAQYRLAEIYRYGKGTSSSCSMATILYKRVVEKSDYVVDAMNSAWESFQESKYESALTYYQYAAELGVEVAQTNAAWLLESKSKIFQVDESQPPETNFNYQQSVKYYKNSAEQNNGDSHLKIGDCYYYGEGTIISHEKAAAYYQAATNLNNPQAMFNLGYMHQRGIGLPKDLYLAKRHYDLAYESDNDAMLPVFLALGSLGFDFAYEFLVINPIQFNIFGSMVYWDTIAITILITLLTLSVIVRLRIVN